MDTHQSNTVNIYFIICWWYNNTPNAKKLVNTGDHKLFKADQNLFKADQD